MYFWILMWIQQALYRYTCIYRHFSTMLPGLCSNDNFLISFAMSIQYKGKQTISDPCTSNYKRH